MRDLYPESEEATGSRSSSRFLLDFDARIDNFLFQAGRWARELYERFSIFMDRFHVAGWRRWVFVEPLSEGATLGAGGLVLMLALAHAGVPRDLRRRLAEEVRARGHVPRPLRQRGRPRGIKHNDSIPLDGFPDHLIKATLATEDRRFYEHFGIDIRRHVARARHQRARRRRACRAAPRSRSSSPRTCS